MKLIDALEITARQAQEENPPFSVLLACGFTPLHLKTFFSARLKLAHPSRNVRIATGLYGDLAGSLERAATEQYHGVGVVLEWADLDARLGLRQFGGPGDWDLDDIDQMVVRSLARIEKALQRLARTSPLALSLPTLPLPPLFLQSGWQEGAAEVTLRRHVDELACCLARVTSVRLVHPARLERLSPATGRFDPKSEIRNGFPYRQSHADALAECLAALLSERQPKKGLITDLDDTVWAGILGEVGVHGVGWDMDHGGFVHAIYQKLLRNLSCRGVLVGVASKNDPALVAEVFTERADLLVKQEHLFPVEAGWGAKSQSVARILRSWNIAADSVVFVDDNAMELAEVAAAHPGIETIQFQADDPAVVLSLLERLRDLFGKDTVSEEDRIRSESLRQAVHVEEALTAGDASADAFLEQAGAVLTISFAKDPSDARSLELINKTNQFNLNGRRLSEAEWKRHLEAPDSFLLAASYEDKFGQLGKIAVMAGRCAAGTLLLDNWVMSCRAFSRRIEHQCLRQLFEHFAVDRAILDFQSTPRNEPLRSFLVPIAGGLTSPLHIRCSRFEEQCPKLYHRVQIITAARVAETVRE
jgi:FkbH-like protein